MGVLVGVRVLVTRVGEEGGGGGGEGGACGGGKG